MEATLEVRVAPGTWIPVATFAEASLAVRQHLDAYALGCSQWGQESAPVRAAGTGTVLARVSYNGRVWTPERDWRKRTEIAGQTLHTTRVEGGGHAHRP